MTAPSGRTSRRRRGAWTCPWLAALAASCGGERVPEPASDPQALLESDPRIELLLAPCPVGGFFDRDLSDPATLLVTKIERAQPDPLKRAKEELGLLGESAFPPLALAFHAQYADMMRSAYLENLVDALAFNASDESHELLLEALQHPQESVRNKALQGLSHLSRPGDARILIERLAIETPELRRLSVAAIFHADPPEAEAFFLDAFAESRDQDLWIQAAQHFPEARAPETARRCGELFARLETHLAPYVAAAAAHAGDEEALAFLRAELREEDPGRRLTAVTALDRADLPDELERSVREDSSPEVRTLAVAAIARAEATPERVRWLRAALGDPSQGVRAAALGALCAAGDPEGLAQALAQLQGQMSDLSDALQALREPLRGNDELARRAYAILLERYSLEEHRPLAQRAATFKAIGQMPLAEAATFLHRTGVEAGDEPIESLRAHEWLMIQASNTGPVGRRTLAGVLAAETDPLRRIDLLDAIGSVRDDLARSFLLEEVENESHAPFERLFAASLVARIGPSWDVAPRLKRVAFGMLGPDLTRTRAALQCLLWHWY